MRKIPWGWLGLVAIAGVVSLFLVFGRQTVWIGYFPLVVEINSPRQFEIADIQVVPCSSDVEVQYALEHGPGGEMRSAQGTALGNNRFAFQIKSTGKDGPFGIEYEYDEPTTLVVHVFDPEQRIRLRRPIPMPPGRGARSIRVSMPP